MEELQDKVVAAVDGVKKPVDNTITLSSGVVLRGKQAPPLDLIKVMAVFPRPKPPVYFNERMGRDMENPDDPDYLGRVKSWEMESSNALLNVLILMGTEFVSTPRGIQKPSDDAWLEEYRELGLPIHPESKSWRYLAWVTHVAVLGAEDLESIRKVVGNLSGVSEDTVQAAEEFPGSNN